MSNKAPIARDGAESCQADAPLRPSEALTLIQVKSSSNGAWAIPGSILRGDLEHLAKVGLLARGGDGRFFLTPAGGIWLDRFNG